MMTAVDKWEVTATATTAREAPRPDERPGWLLLDQVCISEGHETVRVWLWARRRTEEPCD